MFDPETEIMSVKLGRPTLTYKGPIGSRDASELLSVLEQMLSKGSRVLDVGCGPRDQAEPISFLGFEYVGIDFGQPERRYPRRCACAAFRRGYYRLRVFIRSVGASEQSVCRV